MLDPVNWLISTEELSRRLTDPELFTCDIRNVTNQPAAGHELYLRGHIPNAVFLDLDRDLSDRSDLTRGRHPLPSPETFVETLAGFGIGRSSYVVAYDDGPGSNAARLWWMMRWLGSDRVAVLDGGLSKWIAEGRTLNTGLEAARPRPLDPLAPHVHAEMLATMYHVESANERGITLMDARSGERFRGEIEKIDKRAGHIPGAINIPWADTVAQGGVPIMKSSADLRELFAAHGVTKTSHVVTYCGSGVTAALNLLALEQAGLPAGKLYVGSWSEWIEHH